MIVDYIIEITRIIFYISPVIIKQEIKIIMKDKWLKWASELQSIAQAGLTFSTDKYDLDRYEKIRSLSVEILHEYTGVEQGKIRDLFASDTGYQTPKVDIRAAVFNDNKILLVKESIDNCWSLPGGWADVNSSVSESAARECREEAGADVIPRRIIAIQVANRHNIQLMPHTIYKIFVECTLIDSTFKTNTETIDAGFFDPENLPPLSLGRTTEDQVGMCFESRDKELLEPQFD
jgi:ADP-ribose pyrophosphatase YjhB (NUDIX family)